MDPWFRWIEASVFSTWLRESTSVFVYPGMLSAHAIGMGLAAGVGFAVAVRVLGAAPAIPPGELRRLAPLLWGGFAMNAASGVLLLIAYPTKALTNPIFYGKLAAVAAALCSYAALHRQLARPPSFRLRVVAALALTSWAAAIVAGRLLAYTYRRLFVDF